METKISYNIEVVNPTDKHILKELEKMQIAAWEVVDNTEVVPSHVIEIVAETGGQVLAARTNDDRIIGFTLAFLAKNSETQNHPGIPKDELFFASHMAAVLPQLQSCGIGYELKKAQRQEALRRGIRWMQWTYYPMLTKNANLNFIKLGVRCYKFVPDKYGTETGGLYQGLPTDRLIVLWDMQSDLPQEAAAFPENTVPLIRPNNTFKPILDQAVLQAAAGAELSAVSCSVPIEFLKLRNSDLDAARAWQETFANVATTLFSSKSRWIISNFRKSANKKEGEYLFIRE